MTGAKEKNKYIQWYPEVLHFCPTTPIILIGLKSDLRHKRNCVELLRSQGLTPITPEQGAGVARSIGATYVECSSKEMRGVDELFHDAVNIAVSASEDQERESNNNNSSKNQRQHTTTGGNNGASYPSSSPSLPRRKGGKKVKKRACRIF